MKYYSAINNTADTCCNMDEPWKHYANYANYLALNIMLNIEVSQTQKAPGYTILFI